MPRAPFNTTCDIFAGPGSPVPFAFIGTCDCRLVVNDDIDVIGTDQPIIHGWVTMDAITPVGAFVPPYLTLDPTRAYQIAIPSGTLPHWWILFVEEITYLLHPVYRRCQIVLLPLPPVNPPGITCPSAVVTATGAFNVVSGQAPGVERWWTLPIAAGAYNITLVVTGTNAELDVFTDGCATLTPIIGPVAPGSTPLTIAAGPTLDYLVRIRNLDAAPFDVVWDIS